MTNRDRIDYLNRNPDTGVLPDTPELTAVFAAIARRELGIKTLEVRHSDSLDFHDVCVLGILRALKAAYLAGAASRNGDGTVVGTQHSGAHTK